MHTKLELGMFGVARKLVKNVIHLWKPIYFFQKQFSFYSLTNKETTYFGSQGILGLEDISFNSLRLRHPYSR
jgi:hypothetical protein